MTSYESTPRPASSEKLKQYPVGKSPNWIEIVDVR